MTRAQCIVHRNGSLLMVKHRLDGREYWCLPGGGVEPGETPAQAALRELSEECHLEGTILRQTSHLVYAPQDETITFLVEVGDQQSYMGNDPELHPAQQILTEIRWMTLAEMPERDRAFVWAAGLLGVPGFYKEVENWGDDPSYPIDDSKE